MPVDESIGPPALPWTSPGGTGRFSDTPTGPPGPTAGAGTVAPVGLGAPPAGAGAETGAGLGVPAGAGAPARACTGLAGTCGAAGAWSLAGLPACSWRCGGGESARCGALRATAGILCSGAARPPVPVPVWAPEPWRRSGVVVEGAMSGAELTLEPSGGERRAPAAAGGVETASRAGGATAGGVAGAEGEGAAVAAALATSASECSGADDAVDAAGTAGTAGVESPPEGELSWPPACASRCAGSPSAPTAPTGRRKPSRSALRRTRSAC